MCACLYGCNTMSPLAAAATVAAVAEPAVAEAAVAEATVASPACARSRCSRARSLWRCTQPAPGRRSLGASGAASTGARHTHGRGGRHVTHMSMSQYYGQRASRRILRRRWCLGSRGRSNPCVPALWLGSSGPLTCLSSTYAETINSCGLKRMRELDDVATRGKCCRFHARRTVHFENK